MLVVYHQCSRLLFTSGTKGAYKAIFPHGRFLIWLTVLSWRSLSRHLRAAAASLLWGSPGFSCPHSWGASSTKRPASRLASRNDLWSTHLPAATAARYFSFLVDQRREWLVTYTKRQGSIASSFPQTKTCTLCLLWNRMPEYKNQSQVRPWLLYLGKKYYSTVPLPTIEACSGGSGGRDNKELSDMELVFKSVVAHLFLHTCDLYNILWSKLLSVKSLLLWFNVLFKYLLGINHTKNMRPTASRVNLLLLYWQRLNDRTWRQTSVLRDSSNLETTFRTSLDWLVQCNVIWNF